MSTPDSYNKVTKAGRIDEETWKAYVKAVEDRDKPEIERLVSIIVMQMTWIIARHLCYPSFAEVVGHFNIENEIAFPGNPLTAMPFENEQSLMKFGTFWSKILTAKDKKTADALWTTIFGIPRLPPSSH